jgi:two-component system phosphate regulon sensor histidine kinase PhoR
MKVLEQLSTMLLQERAALLAEWRGQVLQIPAARKLDIPALDDHMPRLIEELAHALRRGDTDAAIDEVKTPPAHGEQRYEDGFDIEQVVAEYNILRRCVHDLAERHAVVIRGRELHVLNDVLDTAIGAAVKTFAERQAVEVQRRREEYLAFVAHDLRTPLNAITLSTRILELRWPDGSADSDTAKMLKTLNRNARHLDALVASILRENTHLLTELGIKPERRAFDLWPLVEGVVQDLLPMALARRTRLVNEVPDELATFADASLLRRIFQNLIANAINYTAGGTVTIGARDGPGRTECWVVDDGQGIPPERIARVFDALEKDPAGDGAGLGLAIVKTFVEAHQGTVTVESTPGRGSAFRFMLPHDGRA